MKWGTDCSQKAALVRHYFYQQGMSTNLQIISNISTEHIIYVYVYIHIHTFIITASDKVYL
jgi:hypothetical protein